MSRYVCDWCSERGDTGGAGVARWLMAALRHTAGTASDAGVQHTVERSGRLLHACPDCAPLVRAHDVNGLTDRLMRRLESGEAAGQPVSRVEQGLIFRAIDRALVVEVADENARPTAEQRQAWALASAHTNARAMRDLGDTASSVDTGRRGV